MQKLNKDFTLKKQEEPMALYRDKVFAFGINCAIMKYNKNKFQGDLNRRGKPFRRRLLDYENDICHCTKGRRGIRYRAIE